MFKRLLPLLIIVGVLSIVSLVIGAIGAKFVGGLVPSWLTISQPEPKLPAETIFHLFGFPIANTIIAAWITIIVLVVLSWAVTRRLKLIPGRGQAAFEFALGSLLNFCESVAGEKNGRRFFFVVGTIFLFVIGNAWLSLVPGFTTILIHTPEGEMELLRGANTDLNFPLAVALFSFVFVEYYGLKSLGWHYLTKFANFKQVGHGFAQIGRGRIKSGLGALFFGAIDVFVGVLEFLSELIRIVSFTFRLFGNMTAGEILLAIALFLVPFAPGEIFYGLELFVGFVQALVFAGLTLVFVSMAVAPHEAEAEHAT